MTSDRITKQVIRVICFVFFACILLSCQKELSAGPGQEIVLSAKAFQVGPDGGHYEVTVLNRKNIDIDYIFDEISHKLLYWGSNRTYFQMDELSIRHQKNENTIEIDVAPSDTLNKWRIDVHCLNISDSISIIQNGE